MLSWRFRRQLVAMSVVVIPLMVLAFFVYVETKPAPSCFDNRKNQLEIDVDCGGQCKPCELRNPKPVSLFWTRFVPAGENAYDIAAEIQNSNEVLAAENLKYRFTMHDATGPIAIRDGSTFLFPQERTHVTESRMVTSRLPNRIEFEIIHVDWKLYQDSKPNLLVEERKYTVVDEESKKSSVEARIRNKSPFSFKEIQVNVMLLDQEGNLLGVNRTLLENMAPDQSETVKLIWPREIQGVVASIKIEPRVNVFKSGIILEP